MSKSNPNQLATATFGPSRVSHANRNKSNVLFIGNSHTEYIYSNKLQINDHVIQKVKSHTLDEASDTVQTHVTADTVATVLQITDNNIKCDDVATACEKTVTLINQIRSINSNPIVLSQTLPRLDSDENNSKASLLNASLITALHSTPGLFMVEHGKLTRAGAPIPSLYSQDGVHLNRLGTAELTKNIKSTLARALGNPPKLSTNRTHNRGDGSGRRYDDLHGYSFGGRHGGSHGRFHGGSRDTNNFNRGPSWYGPYRRGYSEY